MAQVSPSRPGAGDAGHPRRRRDRRSRDQLVGHPAGGVPAAAHGPKFRATGSSTARSCPTPSRAGCAASARPAWSAPTCPSRYSPPTSSSPSRGWSPTWPWGCRPTTAHRAGRRGRKASASPSPASRASQHTDSALPAHRSALPAKPSRRPTNPRGAHTAPGHRHSGQVRCIRRGELCEARRAVRGELRVAAAVRRGFGGGGRHPSPAELGGGRGRRSGRRGQQRVVRATSTIRRARPPRSGRHAGRWTAGARSPARSALQRLTSASCTAASDSEIQVRGGLVQHHHRRWASSSRAMVSRCRSPPRAGSRAPPPRLSSPVRHRVEQFAQPGPVQRLDQLGVGGLRRA